MLKRFVIRKDDFVYKRDSYKKIDYSNRTNFVALNHSDGTKTLYPRDLYREVEMQYENMDDVTHLCKIYGNIIRIEDSSYSRTIVARISPNFSVKVTPNGLRILRQNRL
jgi:hypothetical protein